MNTKTDNEEKFSLVKPGAEQFKNESFVQHDLKTLYVQACRELTLQQDKRDKTISIYVAVIAFLVPSLFSKETMTLDGFRMTFAGWVLVIAGLIGVFFSLSVVRYRIYKEVYWITCSVIAQMQNLLEQSFQKKYIQGLFLHCMEKKWKDYVKDYDENSQYDEKSPKLRVEYCELIRDSYNSAEFYMFASIALIASALIGFGLGLVFNASGLAWPFIVVGVAVLGGLCWAYFHGLAHVFRYLSDHQRDSFNFSFGKAWFLHIYKD